MSKTMFTGTLELVTVFSEVPKWLGRISATLRLTKKEMAAITGGL
jgi:bacteriocin-like protein